MEFHFLSFSVFFGFFLFIFMIWKLRKTPKTDYRTAKLPPGPRKLPLIGNMHQLVGSPPHHALRDLSIKYGALMHLKLGEVSMFVVSSPELAKEVMKTNDINISSRPNLLANSIISYGSRSISTAPYGNYWKQLRKICTPELLSAKQVQSFRPIREKETSNLMKSIASSRAGSPINLTNEIFSSTYGITSRAVVGKKSDDQDRFIWMVKEFIKMAGGFSVEDLFPSVKWLQHVSGMRTKLERLQKESDRIMENIINQHKERKNMANYDSALDEAEDLVDVLLNIQKSDNEISLSTNDIKAVVWNILAAGSETSATTVDWAMAEMIKNPLVMKRAQSEVREIFNAEGKVDETAINDMKYLKAIIKETLRLHPPAPLLVPRECGETCQIDGFEIPIKSRVIVNAWAIGRDPMFWDEAERFFPERFLDSAIDYKGNNFEYIPFGAGRRICPGISYGIANVELPLAELLYYFDWNLPDDMKHKDLDMAEASGVTVRRKKDLYLIPVFCNTSLAP